MAEQELIRSPFKFLDPYVLEDKEIFLGRAKEVTELEERIGASRLSLVYGKMGVGKTSLIRCGLADRFSESRWFELYIRRGENMMRSVQQAIYSEVEKDEFFEGEETSLIGGIEALYLYHFRPIYLVFDQLEELFIQGGEEKPEQLKADQQAFFFFLADLLQTDLKCNVILVIQEEYLARLSTFEAVVQELFANRYRVEGMRRPQLKQVIEGTLQYYGIEWDSENTIDLILNNISEPGEQDPELSDLQVYLDRLYQKDRATHSGPILFNAGLVKEVGAFADVMGEFLEEQIRRIDQVVGQQGITEKVLIQLMSEEQTKRVVYMDWLFEKLVKEEVTEEMVRRCIQELEKSRLVVGIEEWEKRGVSDETGGIEA